MIRFQIIGDNYYLNTILQHRIYQSGYLKNKQTNIDVRVYKKVVKMSNLSCMRMSCLKLFMSQVERAVIYC